MYGIVNQAVQELICVQFGREKWEKILEKSGLDFDEFIGMEQYSDNITIICTDIDEYSLVYSGHWLNSWLIRKFDSLAAL